LFRGGGKIKLDVFFPARKAIDERWEVVHLPLLTPNQSQFISRTLLNSAKVADGSKPMRPFLPIWIFSRAKLLNRQHNEHYVTWVRFKAGEIPW